MKRLLSIILAISMILALIPAAFATDTTAEGFTVSMTSTDKNYAGWSRIGDSTGTGQTESNNFRWRAGQFTTSDAEFPVFDPEAEIVNALAFKFNCAAAGEYVPTVNYTDNNYGIIAETHIVSAEEMEGGLEKFVRSAGTSTRIGTVDFYDGDSASLGEVSLAAETDYWIVFIAIGENASRTNYKVTADPDWYTGAQYIASVEFTPAEESPEVGTKTVYNLTSQAFNLSTETYTSANDSESTGLVKYSGADSGSNTNRNAKGGWVASSNNTANAKIRATGTMIYDYIKEGENKWAYDSSKYPANIHAEKAALYMNFRIYNSNDSSIYQVNDAHLTLKLSVPAKGKYNVLLDGTDVKTSSSSTIGGADAIITMADTVDGLDSVTTPWEYNFYSELGEKQLGTFEATAAGECYIRFKFKETDAGKAAAAEGNSNYTSYGMRIKSLTLEYAGETTEDAAVTEQKEAEQNPVINAAVADATEKEASTTNTVSLLKAFIGGDAENTTLTNTATETGGIYTVTADDAPTGYSFLYWTKGLEYDSKRIVSIDKTISFKPEVGGNYLIAVYGKTGDETATKKFINGNGQLITDATDEEHKPSMPGYGAFKGWVDCGNGVYMAEYEGRESYTVTVQNDGTTVETRTPEYGSAVTVTAPARASDGYRLFAYWQKDGEIVSLDRKYTFYAFEDCTVNAVYNEYEPVATSLRKIILTNMGSNNYMAEFIGFGDAVEKGIAVGSKKIAMTTDKTQFTINADETGTVRGYAIDSEGNVYYSK